MAASNFAEEGCLRIHGNNKQLNSNMRSASMGSRLNLHMGAKKPLTAVEERFLVAAELGDVETIRTMLKDLQISVDFSDALGRTPIRLAVGNDHFEVVELLLKHSNNTSIREALLQAINNGNDQIAEFILKYLSDRGDAKAKQKFGHDDFFFVAQEESQFTIDTTPLILAARKNRFHVVLLLLRDGERIVKPHDCYCSCVDCQNKRQFDELRLAKTRLNAYRGLASEAYISLSSKDPILEAFKLGKELRVIADIDKCYKTDYLILADELSQYVVKLLDKVRGHDELEVVLSKVGTDLDEEEESFELLERFKLAIEYDEKKFVAHPACQQKLIRIWYSKVHFLERANLAKKILMGFTIMASFPLMAVSFWFAPRTKVGCLLRSPCVKFMGRLMSHLVFMVMIVISSFTKYEVTKLTEMPHIVEASEGYLHPDAECSKTALCGKTFVIRHSKPAVIDILLAIWIVGMFWQEVKQVYQIGIRGYFNSLFNYLDTAVLILYLSFISLRITCLWKVNAGLNYFGHKVSWEAYHNGTEESKGKLYWLISDRMYWEDHDPENLAEAAFAIANIITFSRICYIFPAHELFGPLQISLVRMATDILTFIAIFLVLFLAFMVGLHNLYWYYPIRQTFQLHDHETGDIQADKNFGLLDLTFRTVFWASLGQSDKSAVQLGDYNNEFTENVGYWIFGAYSVACVIVLLNMLIAMMTRSFDTIQSESHTEWKFARSMLYMEYIKEDCTLPVPFNIVPSPKFLLNTVRAVYSMLVKAIKKEPVKVYHPGRVPDIELFPSQSIETNCSSEGLSVVTGSHACTAFTPGIESFRKQRSTVLQRNDTEPDFFREKLTYKRVMNRIIRRYMYDKHLAECAENEAKPQESVNFRFELQSALSEYQKELNAKFQDYGHQIAQLTKAVQGIRGDEEQASGSAQSTPKRVKQEPEQTVFVHIDEM